MEVKWLAVDTLKNPDTEEKYFSDLSTYRKEKALRHKVKEDRLASIAAGWLLENELRTRGIISEGEDILYDLSERGKPHLKNKPEIHFSISHCNTYAVCLVSDRNIGIDAETITDSGRNFERLMKSRYITESAKEWICNDEIHFLYVWTMAEAVAKAADAPLIKVLSLISKNMLSENNIFCIEMLGRQWKMIRQINNGCVLTIAEEQTRQNPSKA